MDISDRIPVIKVPMPPSTGDKDDEEVGSVAAMTMESHFQKISGLDDPTFFGTAFKDEPNEEDDENRRHVWSKSRRRVCAGFMLLVLAITGVVYVLQSFSDDESSASEATNISATNSNTFELNNDSSILTLRPTDINNDYNNAGSNGSETDDLFSGLNEDSETQEQSTPNRDPDNVPGVSENAADSMQEGTTTPIEDGSAQDLGDNSATNDADPGYSLGTGTVNESGQQVGSSGQDGFECGKDLNVAQTKGGGGWGGGGGGGNRCRDRGDGNGNRRGLGGRGCRCRNNNGGNNRHRMLWERVIWLPGL